MQRTNNYEIDRGELDLLSNEIPQSAGNIIAFRDSADNWKGQTFVFQTSSVKLDEKILAAINKYGQAFVVEDLAGGKVKPLVMDEYKKL